ncbi:MAG: NAD(P)-binding domain-containing protein, partial [Novosphingobium sp.]|nr:NAD(P)-binding domain-containing protein [Novosphingobium sp.]
MSEKRLTHPYRVSFLGLGVMGGAIARHIGQAGHELTIYNRSPGRL